MVHSTSEERAVHLTREAVELIDAGHREVCLLCSLFFFLYQTPLGGYHPSPA